MVVAKYLSLIICLFIIGADLDSLPSYGKRANRIHVNNRKSNSSLKKQN